MASLLLKNSIRGCTVYSVSARLLYFAIVISFAINLIFKKTKIKKKSGRVDVFCFLFQMNFKKVLYLQFLVSFSFLLQIQEFEFYHSSLKSKLKFNALLTTYEILLKDKVQSVVYCCLRLNVSVIAKCSTASRPQSIYGLFGGKVQ